MALTADDQQFCLRWNNFQANITSQFEALRDEEDFTDVTIACEGQRLQAHKVVLSACSPFFKELFKSNPCSHPIIFMRDVEARHIVALMEFMYAGEVNVAQAQLSAFLRTAESLKIRGLTDNTETDFPKEEELYLNPQSSIKTNGGPANKAKSRAQISSSSTVTSSQDVAANEAHSSPPPKRPCKSDAELPRLRQIKEESMSVNPFAMQQQERSQLDKASIQPKEELPDYLTDGDEDDHLDNMPNFYTSNDVTELPGGMEIIPQATNYNKDLSQDGPSQGSDSRKLHSLDPRPCEECGRVYSNLSNLRQHMKLIHFPTYVQCHLCKKTFKTDLYLRRHIISSHDGLNRGLVKSSAVLQDNYGHCVNTKNNNLDPFQFRSKIT